jgi:hypothetical protein
MWMSNTGDVTPRLVFDLGSEYSLTSGSIWQYNHSGGVDRGVNGLRILVSANGVDFTLATTANLSASGGVGDPVAAQTVSFTGTGRYSRFEVTSNHGSPDCTGLSEVKFTGSEVPVAASTLTTTVGTTSGVCATTTSISVPAGTTVHYCYPVTNIGNVTLGTHDLTDSALGSIFSRTSYSLAPASSVDSVSLGFTIPAVITATTTTTGTWTAYNVGAASVQTTASATVTAIPQAVPAQTLTGLVGMAFLLALVAIWALAWRR